MSLQQIWLLSIEVVHICDLRNRDVTSLSKEELDQLLELAKGIVKRVFRSNGFRFLTGISPAHAGELIAPAASKGVVAKSSGVRSLSLFNPFNPDVTETTLVRTIVKVVAKYCGNTFKIFLLIFTC
tara:strand:+ start:1786 stop:2163 length:378 start_codon:yes stop_codon:yes gene_type:complete